MKKSVKLISLLLSVLMVVSIFTALPITASAAQADDLSSKAGTSFSVAGEGVSFDSVAEKLRATFDIPAKDAAAVGAEAEEAVGASVTTNLQTIRNYINSNYDFTDEEGKNVKMQLTDNDNKTINVYLTLLDDGSFSFYMFYYITDTLIVGAQIKNFDFRTSYSLKPTVFVYEGDTDHFAGYMSVNASTYNPNTAYTVNYENQSGEYSTDTIISTVRSFTATSFDVYNFALNDLVGFGLGDIGFGYYPATQAKVAPTNISLNTSALTITKGNTYKLYATVYPSDATDKSVTWSSSNSNVASVSKGTVTAKAGGKVTITAKTSNGLTAKCQVTVTVPATSIKLNKSSVTMTAGTQYKIYATINPSDVTDKTVFWSSSNPSVAGMASGGVIKAKKAGTATITASTKNGKSTTCKVTVKSGAPTGIKLNKSSVTMTAGTTYKLYATITPSNVKNKTVTWSSSNPSVAGMASGGVIKAKKAGSCTITAKTYNGKKTTCKVTVKAKPKTVAATGIKLNKSSVTITAGNTTKLYATITPSNATNKSVTWSSSNSSVASVSGGKITAKKAGTCTITAKTSNGKKATCKVTVKAKPAASNTSTTDVYKTNFNKLRSYISSHGSYDSDGNKCVSVKGNDNVLMTLTNLSSGSIEYAETEVYSSYIYITIVTWNLNKSNSASVIVGEFSRSSGALLKKTTATINVKTYNGSNASFSSYQSLSQQCLNDALDWLDGLTQLFIGVKAKYVGFVNYF